MPVTKPQADMLATLAAAARPHGAPRWDVAGIVAAIGHVKHLHLADVMRAVANAADDRDAKTPGVIANLRSTCWQDRPMRPAELEVIPPEQRCGICAKSRDKCEGGPRFADDDHAFEPDFKIRQGAPMDELRDVVAKARAHPETPDPITAEPKEGAA